MTRLEQIRQFLVDTGPATTKQIAAAFGLREDSMSGLVSHARSYGYISVLATVHLRPKNEGSPTFYWEAREQIIRKPAQ